MHTEFLSLPLRSRNLLGSLKHFFTYGGYYYWNFSVFLFPSFSQYFSDKKFWGLAELKKTLISFAAQSHYGYDEKQS